MATFILSNFSNRMEIIGVTTFVRTNADGYNAESFVADWRYTPMKWLLLVLTVVLIVAHQDRLFIQQKVDPLLGGFLPLSLVYHAAYCVAAAILMALFVASVWPKELENAEPETP